MSEYQRPQQEQANKSGEGSTGSELQVLSTGQHQGVIVMTETLKDPKHVHIASDTRIDSFFRHEGETSPKGAFLSLILDTADAIEAALEVELSEEAYRKVLVNILSSIKRLRNTRATLRDMIDVRQDSKSLIKVKTLDKLRLSAVRDPNDSQLFLITEADVSVVFGGSAPFEMTSVHTINLKESATGEAQVHFAAAGEVEIGRAPDLGLLRLQAYWLEVLHIARAFVSPTSSDLK